LFCFFFKFFIFNKVIWNQCEDPACNQLRILLTVNKDNFIEDLRFRILNEHIENETEPLQQSPHNSNGNSEYEDANSNQSTLSAQHISGNENHLTFYSSDAQQQHHQHQHHHQHQRHLIDTNSQRRSDNVNLHSWTLEIRRFTKKDEGCYQCQLNTFKENTVHYCVKMRPKLIVKPKRLSVHVNKPIILKCATDEHVKPSQIRWFHNGHRLHEETHPGVLIEKKPFNEQLISTLHIRHATLNDAGTYSCRFGSGLQDEMHVSVLTEDEKHNYEKIKSSGKSC
jgi:hypothetical protein